MEAADFKIEQVKKVKLTLMNKDSAIDKKTLKAEYIKNVSATFINEGQIPDLNADIFSAILRDMYEQLLESESKVSDSLGIWITYDGIDYENAISLLTINDIKKYGETDICPIFEFFLMSI